MRKRTRIVMITVGASALLTVAALAVNNAWVTNQDASNVYGQPNFTSAATGTGLNQVNLPYGAVVDPVTGKLFISDSNNNRVLRFAVGAGDGATAEAVFGGTGATAANTLANNTGIAFDASGDLWVADLGNNRVLRFGGAGTLASGSSADRVLGQTTFAGNTAGTSQTTMSQPSAIFVDSGNHLWVADVLNNRVLRFDGASTLASGAAATAVLGQSTFNTNTAALSQTGMNQPLGITADALGQHLWVGDANNQRILRFDNAVGLGNGAPATAVLGSTNFTSTGGVSNQALIQVPGGLAVDANDRLYEADEALARVLIFLSASTAPNGAKAAYVLGQPDFNSFTINNGGLDASAINNTRRISFYEPTQSLYVSDIGNDRVLRFTPQRTTAANVSISGRVTDSRGAGLRGVTVTITDSRGNRLRAVTNAFGYYTFADVPSGDTYIANATSRGMFFPARVMTVNDAVSDLNFSPQ